MLSTLLHNLWALLCSPYNLLAIVLGVSFVAGFLYGTEPRCQRVDPLARQFPRHSRFYHL